MKKLLIAIVLLLLCDGILSQQNKNDLAIDHVEVYVFINDEYGNNDLSAENLFKSNLRQRLRDKGLTVGESEYFYDITITGWSFYIEEVKYYMFITEYFLHTAGSYYPYYLHGIRYRGALDEDIYRDIIAAFDVNCLEEQRKLLDIFEEEDTR